MAKEELRRLYGEDQLSADGVPPPDATGGAPKPKGIGQKYDKWNNYDAEGVIKQLEEREADKERLRLEVARLENRPRLALFSGSSGGYPKPLDWRTPSMCKPVPICAGIPGKSSL